MNASDYSDLLPPLFLGVGDVLCAALLHRAILRNSVLLRRRHFFESLALLALAIALVLLVGGLALWRTNPDFVLVCSGGWMLLCIAAAAVLWYRNRSRADAELTLPDLWPALPERPADEHPPARVPSHHEPASPRPGVAERSRPVPLDAATRARLKRVRRERSGGDGRFRLNLPGSAKEGSPGQDSSEREGH